MQITDLPYFSKERKHFACKTCKQPIEKVIIDDTFEKAVYTCEDIECINIAVCEVYEYERVSNKEKKE